MRTLFSLFLATLLICVSSFATANDGVSPTTLSKPELLTYFVLESDITLRTTVKNVFGRKASLEPVLRKGDYISVFADSEGTYYQGPKDCLPNPNHKAMFPALDGGLWLPKPNSELKPKLWFYLKPMPASFRAGLLIRALDKITAGNVKKDQAIIDDVSFLASIDVLPYDVKDETSPDDRQP